MRFSRVFLAAALTLSALILGAGFLPSSMALAQEVATTKVSVAPLVDGALGYVSVAISAVLTAGIALLGARVYAWTGINIEARHREALHSALMTGINAALGKVSDLIGGQAIDVRSTAVAEAVNYVVGAVPDAVRALGLNDARLREMAASKLQQVMSGQIWPPVALPGAAQG